MVSAYDYRLFYDPVLRDTTFVGLGNWSSLCGVFVVLNRGVTLVRVLIPMATV